MVFKEVNLEGYGKILIQPINIKDKEWESVDPEGKSVFSERVGQGAKTVYKNGDGVEVPRNQLCKKISIEGEDLVLRKFEQTKKVSKDDIEVIDDSSLIYTALDRKFYAVTTENPALKKLVIDEGKSLAFGFVAGGGFKMWKAILTNWQGRLLMVGCIGDLTKELEKYTEETVEIELDVINTISPEKARKLLKVMAMN